MKSVLRGFKWLVFSLLGLILLSVILVAVFIAGFAVQQNLSGFSAQLPSFKENTLVFNEVGFTYQNKNKNQYQIQAQDIEIKWHHASNLFDSLPKLDAILINRLKIQHQAPESSIPTNETDSLPEEISHFLTGLHNTANRQNSGNEDAFTPYFTYLAYLPDSINLIQWQYQKDCANQACQLSGHFKLNKTPQKLILKADVFEPKTPTNEMHFDAQFLLPDFVATEKNIQTLLKEGQAVLTLNQAFKLSLTTKFNQPDVLTTQLIAKGSLPIQSWLPSLKNWGIDAPKNLQNWLNTQPNNLLINQPIDITLSHEMTWHNLAQLIHNPSQAHQLMIAKVRLDTLLSQPFHFASLGDLTAKGQLNFSIHQGLIHASQFKVQGKMTHIPLPKVIQQTGFSEQQYDVSLKGSLPKIFIPQNIWDNSLLKWLKSAFLNPIKFDLALDNNRHRHLTSPTRNANIKATNRGNSAHIDLTATGSASVFPTFHLNIEKGLLNWSQPHLTFKQANKKYHAQSIKLSLPFKGRYIKESLQISAGKTRLTAKLTEASSVLEFKLSKLLVSHFSAKVKLPSHSKQPGRKQQSIDMPLQWNIKAKKLQLLGDLSFGRDEKKFHASDISLSLNQPRLNATRFKINQPQTLNYQFDYKLNLTELQHLRLHALGWHAEGQLQGTKSGKTNQLSVMGLVSNQADLLLNHQTRFHHHRLKTEWQLPEIYLLAGNPFEKTLKDWPKNLVLASGKMSMSGQFELTTDSLTESKNKPSQSLLARLEAETKVKLNHVSGLFKETAFSRASVDSKLQIKDLKLLLSLNNLSVDTLNQGLIFGPIEVNSSYQADLKHLFEGRITLHKFNTKIFKGRAIIAPQTIDLSHPIETQIILKNIDIAEILHQYPSQDLKGSGLLSGTLPFKIAPFEENPFIEIEHGLVEASEQGGQLIYRPAAKEAMGKSNIGMKMLLDVLEDFEYSVLSSQVTIGKNKNMILGLKLQGKNPNYQKGRPINFNITLEENIPALLTSMQITNQVSETIRKRVQEKIQQQQAKKQ